MSTPYSCTAPLDITNSPGVSIAGTVSVPRARPPPENPWRGAAPYFAALPDFKNSI